MLQRYNVVHSGHVIAQQQLVFPMIFRTFEVHLNMFKLQFFSLIFSLNNFSIFHINRQLWQLKCKEVHQNKRQIKKKMDEFRTIVIAHCTQNNGQN